MPLAVRYPGDQENETPHRPRTSGDPRPRRSPAGGHEFGSGAAALLEQWMLRLRLKFLSRGAVGVVGVLVLGSAKAWMDQRNDRLVIPLGGGGFGRFLCPTRRGAPERGDGWRWWSRAAPMRAEPRRPQRLLAFLQLQGRFEILCLSGSYLVIDDGALCTRNGGLCIALCGADHRVIGGSVGGVLTAAGTVQVIVGSFMYAGSKKSRKGKAGQEVAAGEEEQPGDANGGGGGGGEEEEAPSPLMPMPRGQDLPSDAMMGGWTSMMRQMESRSCGIDINSIRE